MKSHEWGGLPIRWIAFALVALQASVLASGSSALELTKGGSTEFRIVLPKDAIPAEQTAAHELQEYLHRVTGAFVPISSESTVSSRSPQILVGVGERVREYLAAEKVPLPVKDSILIKTLPDTLILAGGRPRGSLYAVYSFLEDTVGVRWWTSSETTIPRKPTLSIPELDIRYSPKLLYREAYYSEPVRDPLFAARLKLNGHMSPIPEALGGHYTIIGWCHTSYELLPPGAYFGGHPDWYSMRNGKRSPDGGQLCWSNAEMRRELARQALARIRQQPSAGIISISQNDCLGPCQCDACLVIEKEEGSASGPLIHGINAVAAEIAKEFPDFLIETLAYQYSRKPPAHVRPATNVLVRLCSIEADNSHALSSEENATFRDDLLGWKAISRNLFVWNYVTSFANYLIPHPNMAPLGEDLRFFAENNVVGVFEQGDVFNETGDFLALRVWLLAHLMWDPSRDQLALREEFLKGYYGPAASYLGQYLDLVNAPAKKPSFRVSCYNDNTAFLTDAALEKAASLFEQAGRAVAKDSELARRVKRERLVLDHMQLLRYDFADLLRAGGAGEESVCRDYDLKVSRFIREAKAMGVRNLAEGQSFDSYIPILKARSLRHLPPPKMPAAGAELPEGCFDIQEDRFSLVGGGNWSELTDDPKASNGKAARMGGDHTNWAVQFHIAKDASFAGKGPWKCYVVVRCKAAGRGGGAFSYGLHDANNNGYIARDSISVKAAGEEYKAYGIFVDELKPGMYFWTAPPGNADWVDSIYVDRIYIERDSGDQNAR